MSEEFKLRAEDLADGKWLEEAISRYNKDSSKDNIIDLLVLIRNSVLWVPCNAIMGEADQKRFEELLKNCGDNLEEMVGQEFQTEEQTRLVPDILQNGDSFFFPAFSSVAAMGEYGNSFSKIPTSIIDIIQMARNSDKELVGVVINAFSEPFILNTNAWEILEQMESIVEE